MWPGNQIRQALGVTDAQDNGILRSMINMVVWGVVALAVALLLIKF